MDNINEILTRGVANIIPSKQELEKTLRSGKKLNIYLGIDPTAPKIHLGHTIPIRRLQKFAELGHNVTLLIGDFTALVGDTSDKDSERPILTEKEIKQNFQTYKSQAEKILDFTKVKIRYNSEWLKKLSFSDILRLQQQFSLNDFISRELIKKRLGAGKRVRFDELSYPLMQGYDSYYMDTDIQLGGTDQTFNMQAGRTLQKVLRDKESFIITNVFLDGTDGRKMSKSWGNAIWLNDTPQDMYAKIMAINDDLLIPYFTLATNTPLQEIETIKKSLETGEHPMTLKKKLAHQIVSELHDQNFARSATENFEKIFQKKELPDIISEIKISTNEPMKLDQLIFESGLTTSKAEAKRLIEQGAVKVGDTKITNPTQLITLKENMLLKAGKRKIIRLKINK